MRQMNLTNDSLTTLFVYGTLKRGYWNHERFCKDALSIEEATVRGRLYELPSGIPVLDVPPSDILATGTIDIAHDLLIQDQALMPGDSSICQSGWIDIQGELMTFDDPDQRLCDIDLLEGFVPGLRCLYRRVLLPVYRQGQSAIAAWCYILGIHAVHLKATNSSEWRGCSKT